MRAVVLSALLLSGCAAKMVVDPGSDLGSRYAPVNEGTRPGMIRYLNEGVQAVRKKRRDDAYKKMYNSCDGSYKIISEGSQSSGGAIIPMGAGAIYSDSQYIYIQFECVAS